MQNVLESFYCYQEDDLMHVFSFANLLMGYEGPNLNKGFHGLFILFLKG